MEEKIYLAELFEIYGDLLTDRQKEVFKMHYLLDFSLSEIAEELSVTRQNASDTLKNAKDKLSSLEKALKIREKEEKLRELSKDAGAETSAKILEIIGR